MSRDPIKMDRLAQIYTQISNSTIQSTQNTLSDVANNTLRIPLVQPLNFSPAVQARIHFQGFHSSFQPAAGYQNL